MVLELSNEIDSIKNKNSNDEFQLLGDDLRYPCVEKQMAFIRKTLCRQVIKLLLSSRHKNEDILIKV
jgi:hypothetical protein